MLGANATAECASAALPRYSGIRVMSIYDNRSATPREYIYPEYLLPWSVSSEDSICPGGWGYMSAVCFYTYRAVYEALNVPIGLISNSFGGSRIEEWSSPEALAECPAIVPPPPGEGDIWASYIWNVRYSLGNALGVWATALDRALLMPSDSKPSIPSHLAAPYN